MFVTQYKGKHTMTQAGKIPQCIHDSLKMSTEMEIKAILIHLRSVLRHNSWRSKQNTGTKM